MRQHHVMFDWSNLLLELIPIKVQLVLLALFGMLVAAIFIWATYY